MQSYGYSYGCFTNSILNRKYHDIVAMVTESEVQSYDSIYVHKTEIIAKGMKLQLPVKLATRPPC